jgi:hypothetical protein
MRSGRGRRSHLHGGDARPGTGRRVQPLTPARHALPAARRRPSSSSMTWRIWGHASSGVRIRSAVARSGWAPLLAPLDLAANPSRSKVWDSVSPLVTTAVGSNRGSYEQACPPGPLLAKHSEASVAVRRRQPACRSQGVWRLLPYGWVSSGPGHVGSPVGSPGCGRAGGLRHATRSLWRP